MEQNEDLKNFLEEELTPEEKEKLFSDKGNTVEGSATPSAAEQEEPALIKPPPTPEFEGEQDSSYQATMRAIRNSSPEVEVTPEEEVAFEKAILSNTEPFSTTILLATKTSQLQFEFRVRLEHEFTTIYACAADENRRGLIPDYPALLTRLQELAVAVMLKRVNDTPFGAEFLPEIYSEKLPTNILEKSAEERQKYIFEVLRKRAANTTGSMNQMMFILAISAAKIFDGKCFKLSLGYSTNFSNPE